MDLSSETVVPARHSDRVLVVMAKAPRPGTVKTRLLPSLPLQAVTAFYRCLLEDTLALARSLRGIKLAIMCPDSDVDGLAAGLTSVFAHFAEDHRSRTVAFNSDSPHLPRAVLEQAFETLGTHDVVVGPTYDGGYYLVGANASYPQLFTDNGMGTSSALERLLSQARLLELSVGFTDPFYDIDVADDLIRLATELERTPTLVPRTASWLREWGHAVTQLRTGTDSR
jgi:uncharacterized protein